MKTMNTGKPGAATMSAACALLFCWSALAGCKEDRKPEPKVEAAAAAAAPAASAPDAGPLAAQHDALDKAKGVEAQVQAQADAHQKTMDAAVK